ncbi:copper homeostasis protein CutC [Photobacterium halotolerans]|uniref:PF03932 family protein CutC n=1 Tax=Photobacterium halotolerans TaxID=265726 RepID=A0A7X4WT40_9GAMM|nr:copper homeostasis protein CutC [Photobacterium halotolerans]NAW64919.1 copper homeostasis protein CutC [Photobacterium halotolerans]NAW88058.1 copper homeostasis protein CutC [Photobacterium halotolerans]
MSAFPLTHLEVCIDNIESLHAAQQGGASRIELCSSLALGGLTPSVGLMHQAARIAKVPVYAMIRPRQGDFLFSGEDMEVMLADIHAARQIGLQGVVMGVLTAQGKVDTAQLTELMKAATGLGVTFHRAIDQCDNYTEALDAIMSAGCERVLSSGLQSTALEGAETLADMVRYCGDRLSIMAGAGITASNAAKIVAQTGVKELHLSGKTTRPSLMEHIAAGAHMGNQDVDDYAIPVTSSDKIAAVITALKY